MAWPALRSARAEDPGGLALTVESDACVYRSQARGQLLS
jgi:hypothetical protein